MDTKAKEQLCGEVFSIETKRISKNPNQPRKVFAEESIIKLADSIRQFGIMQPLTVRQAGDEYELIAGERRLRAAIELGLEKVPCIITNASAQKSAEMAIIENLMRENLNIFEQAEAIQVLIDTYNLTQDEIASKLSSSQSFVANKLRLLRLNQEERELIISSKLTERHARALLKICDEQARKKLLDLIISEELNVSKSEALIDSYLQKNQAAPPKPKTYKSINSFYESLGKVISTASNSGIKIKSRRLENDECAEFIITIMKESAIQE